MRDGHLFVFNPFELDTDSFLERAGASVTAFAEGLTGLPYPVFCGVAGLTINGETRLAMVMAKEVDNLVGADGRDLGEGWWIHAVVPWHLPSGDVWFEPVSRLIRLFAAGGKTFGRPFEPPIGEFATEMLGAQVEVLAVMLAMIAEPVSPCTGSLTTRSSTLRACGVDARRFRRCCGRWEPARPSRSTRRRSRRSNHMVKAAGVVTGLRSRTTGADISGACARAGPAGSGRRSRRDDPAFHTASQSSTRSTPSARRKSS